MKGLSRTLFAGLIAGSLVVWVANATGQMPTPKETPKVAVKAKVYRLVHTDPGEVREILDQLLDFHAQQAAPQGIGLFGGPIPGGAGPMPPGGMLGLVGNPNLGFGGNVNLGFGGQLGLGGNVNLGQLGFGGNLGQLGFGANPPTYTTAIDARTRALIVRGTEKDLQVSSDLVAVLDLPRNKPAPEVKSIRVVTLKHAEAAQLIETLESLNLEAKIVSAPMAKLIIVTGTDEGMKEASEIIKELDVPTPKENPAERRLLRDKDIGQ